MNISLQQALDVLLEWKQKKCIVQGGFTDSLGNQAFSFGCIQEVGIRSVRIDARAFSEKTSNVGMFVGLEGANFSFGSWPDAPAEHAGQVRYESFLEITLPNGSKCHLFATNL
jgi:hypothetical protein